MGLTSLTQEEGLVLGDAWGQCLYPISTTYSEDVSEEAVCGLGYDLGVLWTDKDMCSWLEARYGSKPAEDQDWAS